MITPDTHVPTMDSAQRPCVHRLIRQGFLAMLGFDGCSESYLACVPWVLMSLLYVSTIVRYRRYTFRHYYERHGPPTFYARLTRVPWEALLASLVLIPRLYWVIRITASAIVYDDAWKSANFSNWMCWGLICYVGLIDTAERRMTNKRLLKVYWAQKQRDTEVVDVKTVLLETEPEKEASAPTDTETGTLLAPAEEPAPKPRTILQRFRAAMKKAYLAPTAASVLTSYQFLAFLKVFFSFVFLSETALSSCRLSPAQLLNSEHSLAPAMIFCGLFYLVRFAQVLGQATVFSDEVDWKALEQENA